MFWWFLKRFCNKKHFDRLRIIENLSMDFKSVFFYMVVNFSGFVLGVQEGLRIFEGFWDFKDFVCVLKGFQVWCSVRFFRIFVLKLFSRFLNVFWVVLEGVLEQSVSEECHKDVLEGCFGRDVQTSCSHGCQGFDGLKGFKKSFSCSKSFKFVLNGFGRFRNVFEIVHLFFWFCSCCKSGRSGLFH